MKATHAAKAQTKFCSPKDQLFANVRFLRENGDTVLKHSKLASVRRVKKFLHKADLIRFNGVLPWQE